MAERVTVAAAANALEQLSRCYAVDVVARRTNLTPDVVRDLRARYGGDDLDALAKAAHDLRTRRPASNPRASDAAPATEAEASPAPASGTRAKTLDELTPSQLLDLAASTADDDQPTAAAFWAAVAALDELRRVLATARARRDREARRVLLEAQLAAIRAELDELQQDPPPPRRPVTAEVRQQLAAIRAWAAEAGVECSPFGKIPARVVAAYEASRVAA